MRFLSSSLPSKVLSVLSVSRVASTTLPVCSVRRSVLSAGKKIALSFSSRQKEKENDTHERQRWQKLRPRARSRRQCLRECTQRLSLFPEKEARKEQRDDEFSLYRRICMQVNYGKPVQHFSFQRKRALGTETEDDRLVSRVVTAPLGSFLLRKQW